MWNRGRGCTLAKTSPPQLLDEPEVMPIHTIYGIIPLDSPYIIAVTKAEIAANLSGINIFKILDVEMIRLGRPINHHRISRFYDDDEGDEESMDEVGDAMLF